MSKTTRSAKAASNAPRFFKLDLMGEANSDLCFLDKFVEGIGDEIWRPATGKPLAPVYPRDARILMSKKKHHGIELTSFLANSLNIFVGSKEFKEVIEAHCAKGTVEYLPFTLYDHRNRPYSDDYFIINPIGTFDCLDFKASEIDWSESEPDRILDIEEHVLDRKKMKDAPQLFRVDRDAETYIIGLELIRAMKKHEFSNIVVEELEFSDSR
ncbi:imm11 family protein [Archangium lansingense]|uniref:imm11 family protein n=1 Tax=Archangium lansingense TaxID=2995310 RepID=UPI003B809771